ncbi:MAG: hypothetical protein EKK39_14755 [Sphingobacteriales bacterium]|nr:MAG: hypothetical protein EKK39_14755 [Sphingobacteriales bacterium]
MQNIARVKRGRDVKRAALVKKTAELMGVSQRYVNMVLAGERDSDCIISCYMELLEGENLLLEKVRQLLPFN